MMRKLFIAVALVLALATLGTAQTTTTFYRSKTFSATGSGDNYDLSRLANGGLPIVSHDLIWYISGTVTTCQVKLEKSTDGSSWSDLISAQTCTSTGRTSSSAVGAANYVRITMSTLSGGGSVTVVYKGQTTVAAASGTDVNVHAGDGTSIAAVGDALKVSASIDTTGLATSAKQPALGTAGSASADVITVQGISSMTPLLVTLSGNNDIRNISGTISLPTGAATAVKQPALGTAGSPSADVITIQGTASMTAVKVDGSAVTQPISAASLPLPTSAATSTKQSDGSQKTQIVDGAGNVIASTSNNLNVQCANCSGSGASAADEASFTAGSSTFAPSGGFFQTTATNNALTNGQQGMMQLTAQRALFTNLRNASGTEIGTASTPIQVSLANTGSNATAVKVDGSAVTQPVSGTVTANAGTGNFTVVQGSGTNLHVVCDSGCSSSTAPADNSNFDAGTTSTSPIAGYYHATRDTVTDDRLANIAINANRAILVQLEDSSKNAINSTSNALDENVKYLGGNAIATNSGNKDAGTLRMVLATDQPNLTTPLNVQPPLITYNSTQPTLTNGQTSDIQITTRGEVKQVVMDAEGNARGANVNASNQLSVSLDNVQYNTGNASATTQRVAIATDQPAMVGFGIYTEDAGETAGGNLSMAGSVRRDTAASSAGSTGDNATINTDANGLLWVHDGAVSTGGVTQCTITSAATTNATSCGTAATGWYGARIFNTTTTVYYLRRYNTSGTPTCSSATGFIDSIPLPPASAAGLVGGFVEILPIPETATFTTGLRWCITGGSSSTDNTAAAAGIFGAVYKKQ